VLCIKKRKIEDLDEGEVKFLLFITRINCSDNGVVRKSLRGKWVSMGAECIGKGNYKCHPTGT
jgi:hypothetical protein